MTSDGSEKECEPPIRPEFDEWNPLWAEWEPEDANYGDRERESERMWERERERERETETW